MIDEKKTLRLGQDRTWSGNLVWEPMPVSLLLILDSRAYYQSSCVPAELDSIVHLAPHLAVISPNILEIQSLLATEPSAHTTLEEVSQAAQAFHDLISAQNTTVPAIIVRAGRLGSYTLSPQWSGWVPPYFTTNEQGRVVDPTGGGNGFLGGLCAGLLISDGDMREGSSLHRLELMTASLYAAAAASFAIEQKGLPRLTIENGHERWNEDAPLRRLQELRQSISTD